MTEMIPHEVPDPRVPRGDGVLTGSSAASFWMSPPQRPCRPRLGRSHFRQEDFMFEAHSQTELEELMKDNVEFRQLFYRHKELDKKVLNAELGVLPVNETTLSQMKREKLQAKDRLTSMYDALQH